MKEILVKGKRRRSASKGLVWIKRLTGDCDLWGYSMGRLGGLAVVT